jgi:hemoglobin
VEESAIYPTIGEEGFTRLIAAFYSRVPKDPVLGPMYPPDDMAGAERRLRDFLIYRFGGPQRYIAERGHPRLRMRHAPFPVDLTAREHWLKMMRESLDEVAFPEDVHDVLWNFFENTATAMLNTLPEE